MASTNAARKWALALGLLAILASLAVDLHLTRKYGGVDLRDKIVSARDLLAGRSLYYDPWQPGEPERFADPSLPPGTTMTRYTGTPFQALLLAPLGQLPFGAARLAWLFLQYLLLAGALLAAFRAFVPGQDRGGVAGGAVVLLLVVLAASDSWRLHVERGQVYVIFAFLIALLFRFAAARRHLLLGMTAMLLALLKPPALLIFLPLVLRSTRRMWAGGALLLLLAAGAFALLPKGLAAWPEYASAMRAWGGYAATGVPPVVFPDKFTYPETIEGLRNLSDMHDMEFEEGSAYVILEAILFRLPPWTAYAGVLLYFTITAFLFRHRFRHFTRQELLLWGFTGWVAFMMLMPAPRFNYQFVLWAAPLCYLLLQVPHRSFLFRAGLLVAAILVLGGWSLLPVNVLLAEVALLALLLYCLATGDARNGMQAGEQEPALHRG